MEPAQPPAELPSEQIPEVLGFNPVLASPTLSTPPPGPSQLVKNVRDFKHNLDLDLSVPVHQDVPARPTEQVQKPKQDKEDSFDKDNLRFSNIVNTKDQNSCNRNSVVAMFVSDGYLYDTSTSTGNILRQ